jgi:nitroreductase
MKEINIRRSVRQFSDKKVDESVMFEILKAAMQAPSAMNQQPWEFILIQDKNKIEELSNLSPHAKFSKNAAFMIAILAKKDLKAPGFVQQDLGACTQNLMLEAVSYGIGSTWMGVYSKEDRSEFLINALNIDSEKVEPFALIALGYPNKEDLIKYVDRFDENRIHREMY